MGTWENTYMVHCMDLDQEKITQPRRENDQQKRHTNDITLKKDKAPSYAHHKLAIKPRSNSTPKVTFFTLGHHWNPT